jgi:hypothetical protein
MFEDFEEALAEDGKQRRRYCGFGRWVRTLGPEDRARAEELVDWVDESGVPVYNCRQLARYFASKGATFNDQVLNRHRNSRCCGQSGA